MPDITELLKTYLCDTDEMRRLTNVGMQLGETKSDKLDYVVESSPLLQDIRILKAEIGRK